MAHGRGGDDTKGCHSFLQCLETVMLSRVRILLKEWTNPDLLAGYEHIKTMPKCKVTHDIERVEVKPKGRINFMAGASLQLVYQGTGVSNYAALVVTKCLKVCQSYEEKSEETYLLH
jgi:hypothetical protein